MMPNINKIIATAVVVLLAAAAGFYIGKTEENKMDNWQKNDPEMAALWDNFITNDVLPHGSLDSKTRHLAQLAAADDSHANMEKTLEGFRGFTEDCLDGAKEKGVIYGTGAWNIGDIKGSPAMNEAYLMGKNA